MLVTPVRSPASSLKSIHSEIAISLIYLRNNTIEDPEFKQALSDLNPDVIYEKLKVICKRNPKGKFLNISPPIDRYTPRIQWSESNRLTGVYQPLFCKLWKASSKMEVSKSGRITS